MSNVLHYMYDKPDSQYSQLVMAARKVRTETPGSSVSEARAKSAVAGTDSQSKVVNPNPSYEAITQQTAYLMSTITNQNTNKTNGQNGPNQNNGDRKFPSAKLRISRRTERIWNAGDVNVKDMDGESVQPQDKVITFL